MVPAKFFEGLWGEATGWIELACIGGIYQPKTPRDRKVHCEYYRYPDELGAFVSKAEALSGKTNVYYGVTLKKAPATTGRSRAEDTESATAVWVDIDKDFNEGVARLRAFPIKASAGVLSGRPTGGAHAYWFLKEPVSGGDLGKIRTLNSALAKHFGGDSQAVDLARILRLPGTLNLKYDKPHPCKLNVFRPDLRYTIFDFDEFLVVPEDRRVAESGRSPAALPEKDLPAALVEKLWPILSGIWIQGWRHRLALYVAGMLAHCGFSERSAKELVRRTSDAAHDDETDARLKDVEGTYRNYVDGKPVAGAPSAERLLSEFPAVLQEPAKKAYQILRSSVMAASGGGERGHRHANFKIDRIVKYDSRPAYYEITIRCGESRFVVKVRSDEAMVFRAFRNAAFEQGNAILAGTQTRWESILAEALGVLEIEEAPDEASPDGAMRECLESFLGEKQPVSDPALLKAVPGYGESDVFFRLETFRKQLKEFGLTPTRPEVCKFLKRQGWENQSRRMKNESVRIWTRALSETDPNGQMRLALPSEKNLL